MQSFFVSSEHFIEMFRDPQRIQVGDRFVGISEKFSDVDKRTFLGFNYVQYYVVECVPISASDFQLKLTTSKFLDFEKTGTIYTVGKSQLRVQLSATYEIENVRVISSFSTIVATMNEFVGQGFEGGSYELRTIRPGWHEGKLVPSRYSKWRSSVGVFVLFLIVLFVIGVWFRRN